MANSPAGDRPEGAVELDVGRGSDQALDPLTSPAKRHALPDPVVQGYFVSAFWNSAAFFSLSM